MQVMVAPLLSTRAIAAIPSTGGAWDLVPRNNPEARGAQRRMASHAIGYAAKRGLVIMNAGERLKDIASAIESGRINAAIAKLDSLKRYLQPKTSQPEPPSKPTQDKDRDPRDLRVGDIVVDLRSKVVGILVSRDSSDQSRCMVEAWFVTEQAKPGYAHDYQIRQIVCPACDLRIVGKPRVTCCQCGDECQSSDGFLMTDTRLVEELRQASHGLCFEKNGTKLTSWQVGELLRKAADRLSWPR